MKVDIEKPVKRKKKSLDNSLQSNEVQIPGKKKKNKHMSPNSKEASENPLHAEELGNYIKKNIKKEKLEPESGDLNSGPLKGKKGKEKTRSRTSLD